MASTPTGLAPASFPSKGGQPLRATVEAQHPNSTVGEMDDRPLVIQMGAHHPRETLLSTKAVRMMRDANTSRNLQSNKWFEFASISRWCTTGLIAVTMTTIVQAAIASASSGSAMLTLGAFAKLPAAAIWSALGTAATGPLVLGLVAAVAVSAYITVKASQHSRKLFVERTFDVQDFQMQRQAELMGKSVGKAVDDIHEVKAEQGKWAGQVMRTETAQSHTDRVRSQRAAHEPHERTEPTRAAGEAHSYVQQATAAKAVASERPR